MKVYHVTQYFADGDSSPDRFSETAGSLAMARSIVRNRLGSLRARKWGGETDLVGHTCVEAYHQYPSSHPHSFGCGGYEITYTRFARCGAQV